MKRLVLSLCLIASASSAYAQDAFINEFHYDDISDDDGEFVEVALATSKSPADFALVFYNGSSSSLKVYDSIRLSACNDANFSSNGYDLFVCEVSGIQNGSPDGIALVDSAAVTVLQFLSYEGSFTAADGPAAGLPSTDVEVAESNSTPEGFSISWTGTVWNLPNPATPGQLNNGQAALPAELVSFSAVASGNGATLRWTTGSETNNAGFDVQQQVGAAWKSLGFVAGNGTTLEARSYAYNVPDLAPGAYRFRLKQVDFDGAFEFSPEVELTVAAGGPFALTNALPNPARDRASFTLSVQRSQNVTVELYNLLGQRVSTLFGGRMAENESRSITIEAASLPTGVYVYRVQGETFATSRQVTVIR